MKIQKLNSTMMILTLVHEWKNVAYLFEELIRILFKEHLCVAPPINVAHNMAFFYWKC